MCGVCDVSDVCDDDDDDDDDDDGDDDDDDDDDDDNDGGDVVEGVMQCVCIHSFSSSTLCIVSPSCHGINIAFFVASSADR